MLVPGLVFNHRRGRELLAPLSDRGVHKTDTRQLGRPLGTNIATSTLDIRHPLPNHKLRIASF